MADLGKILEGLANQSTNVEQLTKSLKQLEKASSEAFAAGDPKLLKQLQEMEAGVKKLMKTTEKQKAVSEEMRKEY